MINSDKLRYANTEYEAALSAFNAAYKHPQRFGYDDLDRKHKALTVAARRIEELS